ncbi:MAG: MauE/DoxX family redox-associated membrane protein [Solirubrobacteraceae bacterium]
MAWAALIRFAVALVLLVSAIAKLPRLREFIEAVGSYELLPGPLTAPAGLAIVTAEAFVASALLAGFVVQDTLIGAAALFVVFASAVSIALRRKQPFACGCLAGVVPLELGRVAVFLNTCVAIACVAAAFGPMAAGPLGIDANWSASDGAVVFSASILVAASYWLTTYAASVTKRIEAATEGPRVA